MPLRAKCPAGHIVLVPEQRAGAHLRCPVCKLPFTAPSGPGFGASQAGPPPFPSRDDEGAEVEAPPPATVDSRFDSSGAKRSPPPWTPDPGKQRAALHWGVVLGVLALFGAVPAVWEWFAMWQNIESAATPPWVYAILLASLVQLAYAVYLSQAPDWSALWATTGAMVVASAGYALMLGTTLMGRSESTLVVVFGYADKLPGNRAAMWCFVMLCLTSVVTYFLGLTAVRWQRAYRVMRSVREGSSSSIGYS
jgi:hypothetical protein